MPTTNHQIMRARKLLGLSVDQLSSAAGVHKTTIQRFENDARVQKLTLEVLRKALEYAGAEFHGDGAVVDRRNRSKKSVRLWP